MQAFDQRTVNEQSNEINISYVLAQWAHDSLTRWAINSISILLKLSYHTSRVEAVHSQVICLLW